MTLPAHVGILGGGRMGAGIAHAFRLAGCVVTVVEVDSAAAEGAAQRVDGLLASSVARGSTTQRKDELREGLSFGVDRDAFTACDLIIEAVPEQRDLKAAALADVERRLGVNAWLASNTSSLSIDDLARALTRPERFFGLHFFNPVPSSKLVEVVLGSQTAPELRAVAADWVDGIGKRAIVVGDAPGFASSRLGVALYLEALRMLEQGVASAEDIDAAMELGYRHETGPLRTGDIVGLDVRLGIAEYLHATLGERFAPPELLREKVARGELGRKTGVGIFDWSD